MSSLEDWLARQQQVHLHSIDLGLERIGRVARRLGLDRPSYPVITVAGTNGKGSTVAFAEELLRGGGVRVGAFTSPHLVRYNERVRIDGVLAADAELVAAFERIEATRGETTLTYFEYSMLAALELFARRAVETAVLEVGLGGRLDAANLIDADVAVVTSVGFDHREWLGDTLEAIGREKAGILRRGRPAVLASAALPASVLQTALELGACPLIAGRDYSWAIEPRRWRYRGPSLSLEGLPHPSLIGEVQFANAAAALAALEALAATAPQVAPCLAPETVCAALRSVELPGRFQIVPGEPEWVLDVAHNEPAAQVLAANLAQLLRARRTWAVVGILADKDVAAIAGALAPHIDEWIACTLEGPRGLPAAQLREQLPPGARSSLADSVLQGLEQARERARPGDRIVVFGSFHTVGPALDWLRLY